MLGALVKKWERGQELWSRTYSMKFTSLTLFFYKYIVRDRRKQIELYLNSFRKMGVKIGKNEDMYDVSIDSLFHFWLKSVIIV